MVDRHRSRPGRRRPHVLGREVVVVAFHRARTFLVRGATGVRARLIVVCFIIDPDVLQCRIFLTLQAIARCPVPVNRR